MSWLPALLVRAVLSPLKLTFYTIAQPQSSRELHQTQKEERRVADHLAGRGHRRPARRAKQPRAHFLLDVICGRFSPLPGTAKAKSERKGGVDAQRISFITSHSHHLLLSDMGNFPPEQRGRHASLISFPCLLISPHICTRLNIYMRTISQQITKKKSAGETRTDVCCSPSITVVVLHTPPTTSLTL